MVPGVAQEITEFTPLSKYFPKDSDLSEALGKVFDADVGIVIFGHTHYPVVEEFQGVLMVNPGSPNLPKQIRRLGQVAIIELGPDHKSAEILDLPNFSFIDSSFLTGNTRALLGECVSEEEVVIVIVDGRELLPDVRQWQVLALQAGDQLQA